MLKKYMNPQEKELLHREVYLVTNRGKVLSGYQISEVFLEFVMLNPLPISGMEKQGFTYDGKFLYPNWCAGKRKFLVGCFTREAADQFASDILS